MLYTFPKHFPSYNFPLVIFTSGNFQNGQLSKSDVAASLVPLACSSRGAWHLPGPNLQKTQRSPPLQPAAPQKAESKMYIWEVARGKVPNTISHFSSVFSQIIVVLISGPFSKYSSRQLSNRQQHFKIKRKNSTFSCSNFINFLYIY